MNDLERVLYFCIGVLHKGACTNHVDRILGNFDSPLPYMQTLLLNNCYCCYCNASPPPHIFHVVCIHSQGASIIYIDKQEGGPCKCANVYFINLSTQGEGNKKPQKSCQRSLWMPLAPLISNQTAKIYFKTTQIF